MIFHEEDEALLIPAMRTYGGSFAQALAEAWSRADAGNREKLASLFGHMLYENKKFIYNTAIQTRIKERYGALYGGE